jgi:hypothetical protein
LIPPIIKNEWKVACFTLDQDQTSVAKQIAGPADQIYHDYLDPGYAHPRMWTQYAGNHKGVCICFQREKFENDLRKRFNGQYFSGKVDYDKEKFVNVAMFPPFVRSQSTDILFDIKNLGPKGAAQNYVLNNIQSFFLRKNPDWASETEFRCLVHDPNNQIEDISIEEYVTEIIVGMDFPRFFEPSLTALCNKLNIRAQRVEWSNGLPKLAPFIK